MREGRSGRYSKGRKEKLQAGRAKAPGRKPVSCRSCSLALPDLGLRGGEAEGVALEAGPCPEALDMRSPGLQDSGQLGPGCLGRRSGLTWAHCPHCDRRVPGTEVQGLFTQEGR